MKSQNKKSKKQNVEQIPVPTGPYTYIIYAIEPPKKISGLLGDIHFHCIHLLLTDGEQCIQESVSADCDPVEWYKDVLESQEMYVKNARSDISKRQIWIQIDTVRTNIEEFTGWRDNFSEGSLVWRTFWFPTHADTTKECLGFEVSATKQYITQGVSLSHVFHTVLDENIERP